MESWTMYSENIFEIFMLNNKNSCPKLSQINTQFSDNANSELMNGGFSLQNSARKPPTSKHAWNSVKKISKPASANKKLSHFNSEGRPTLKNAESIDKIYKPIRNVTFN